VIKNLIEGDIGGKGGLFALASGKRPIIGRKLARSTVHRTTISLKPVEMSIS